MDSVELAGHSSFVDEMISHLLLLLDDARNRFGNAAAESMLLANEISQVFALRQYHCGIHRMRARCKIQS
jgi:hypothetical protein